MGYKLLLEILNYDENKESFTEDEQMAIEAELKEKTKKSVKRIGEKIISTIDYINRH